VRSSTVIRWGGAAAVVAGVLFIIIDLIGLFVFGFGQRFSEVVVPPGLFFRSTVAPVAEALVLLGLVALYAHQSEATGVAGLISFLVTFLGMVLAQSFLLANLLANLGWALFGVSSLRAGVYPRTACILLIIGAVSTAVVSVLPRSDPGSSFLVYVVIGADIILNAAIAWLGLNLFRTRGKETQQPS
jgi:uncharacterized membrane protein